jgi:hypothetical protein
MTKSGDWVLESEIPHSPQALKLKRKIKKLSKAG